MQSQLDFHAVALAFDAAPPGFAVHTMVAGDIVSHIHRAGPLRG